ncbi:MAG: leucine-rich repeat domain-containing protein [Muribaculaceae bacterium]|nr:leucine-rich repeat domain-containing protein [Muribaculaceae bacterium]
MKKLNLIFMMILVSCCAAFAQATFEENGILYMEDLSDPSKMAVVVIQKTSPMDPLNSLYSGSVIIPAHVEHDMDTYEVVGIAPMAFKGEKLEELTIENGPTMVGDWAFNNSALRRLTYPGSLGRLPHLSSEALEELIIGEGVVEINTVIGGGKLKKVVFPKSLEVINMCFLNIKDGNLKIGPNIREINMSFTPFTYRDLNISGKNAKIWGSFSECPDLQSLDLSGISIIENSFNDCPMLEELDLGSVETLSLAFFDTPALKRLIIPKHCRQVSSSFFNANSLELLKIEEGVQTIEKSFFNTDNLRVLYVPSSLSLNLDLRGNKLEEVHLTSKEPTEECPVYIKNPNTDKLKVFVPKKSAENYRKAWEGLIDSQKVEILEE